MNSSDYVTLLKNKLKLALCFEKIYSFAEALAFYSDCIQDAKRFMEHRLKYRVTGDQESYLEEISLAKEKTKKEEFADHQAVLAGSHFRPPRFAVCSLPK